jgi:hypothetical protein
MEELLTEYRTESLKDERGRRKVDVWEESERNRKQTKSCARIV